MSRDGSVDWLCFPRSDSPSVLARRLGPDAGHISIRPVGEAVVQRRHRDRTLVLETTFQTAVGVVRLVDALPVGPTDRGQGLGADAPHALLRPAEALDGHAEIDLQYAPRPVYGLTAVGNRGSPHCDR